MYKTLYAVTVHPIQGDPVEFVDSNTTPGAGSAVLAQLTANKDVDSVVGGGGNITHIIIPLHAVDYAEVEEQRGEGGEYEDDNAKNCTGGGETGTLTIKNNSERVITAQVVLFMDKPGTYGDVEFELETGKDGTKFLVGDTPAIQPGASYVIDGIPIGTAFEVGDNEGTIPGEATINVGSH